jgi:hypothetical protein
MALEAQKIDREDSTSFESVLIDDKTQNSSNIVFHSDIILTEEAKVFKEQKNIACNNSNSIAEKINFANKNCLKK